MKKITSLIILALLFGCAQKTETINPEVVKAEIIKTEDDFKKLSQSKGIAEAFYFYADENAVIKRENDTLIKGKENIKDYYLNPKFSKATVSWKPDFVEVANDGSMAYSYGEYIWNATDSFGNKQTFTGVFHTVWKKQKDGSWKYTWD